MTLNMNQFEMQPVAGDISLPHSGMIISAAVASSESTQITPGQAVKIDSSAAYGGVPQVLALTANTQESFGIVVRNLKQPYFTAGQPLELAMNNAVIWMTAGVAINPGQFVEFIYTTKKLAVNTGVNPSIGRALDKSSGNGSLIRVLVQVPHSESSSA
jgi:hypothetical protein